MMVRYFRAPLSSGFVSLYTGKMIVMIASGLLGIFLPIFFYTLFDDRVGPVFLYYGISSLLYVVTIAWGVKFLNHFGFQRSLQMSAIFAAIFYAVFFFVNEENALSLLSWSLLALTAFRLLYWIPYHVDFAKFSDSRDRGKEVGVFSASNDFFGIVIPVIAGALIVRFGFDVLFLLALVLHLVSAIPYLTLPPANERYSWGYLETWEHFFSKKRRAMVLTFLAEGAESFVALTIWPIFIFQILHGDYLEVGAISTLIVAAGVVLQLILGKCIDEERARELRVLRTGSILYALGWIAKMFIVTAAHVFFVGAYHSVVKIFLLIPYDALRYDVAADEGHYVDEFTVLREMAIHLGKILLILVAFVLLTFTSLQWTFLIAAFSSLGFNMLRHVHRSLNVSARVTL